VTTSVRPCTTHHQSILRGGLEHLPDALARLGTALDVALGANLLRNGETLGPADRSLVHPREVLDRLGVVAQVLFAGDEDDRQSLTKVEDLGDPLHWVSRV
jgi:hypothetical protein